MSWGLLMAFIAGPIPGVGVVVLKDVLYLLFRARSIFGPLANLIAVGTFVGVAGWVYHRRPIPSWRWLVASCAAGALARIVVMIPANFVILNLQFGLAPAKVAALVWPVIIPFNGLASVINMILSAALMLVIARRGLAVVRLGGPRS